MNVNIYRCDGEWYYAAFDGDGDGGYDHSDSIDVAEDAGPEAAAEAVREMFPDAEIRRVQNVSLRGI